MIETTMPDRTTAIQAKAEETALRLIDNDLRSDDPLLADLCVRLERFRPLLKSATADRGHVQFMLKTGFQAVPFEAQDQVSDTDEIVRLLHLLVDKLESMSKGLL